MGPGHTASVTVARSLGFVLRVRGTTDELLQRRNHRTVYNSESSPGCDLRTGLGRRAGGPGDRFRSCLQETREELAVQVEAHA